MAIAVHILKMWLRIRIFVLFHRGSITPSPDDV
jgi:hypothetical protein